MLHLCSCTIRCHILKQISDRVAFGLERCGAPRHTGGRLRVNSGRVIDKVGVKAALLDLLGREITRQLVHDSGDHLHVRKFIRALMLSVGG